MTKPREGEAVAQIVCPYCQNGFGSDGEGIAYLENFTYQYITCPHCAREFEVRIISPLTDIIRRSVGLQTPSPPKVKITTKTDWHKREVDTLKQWINSQLRSLELEQERSSEELKGIINPVMQATLDLDQKLESLESKQMTLFKRADVDEVNKRIERLEAKLALAELALIDLKTITNFGVIMSVSVFVVLIIFLWL